MEKTKMGINLILGLLLQQNSPEIDGFRQLKNGVHYAQSDD